MDIGCDADMIIVGQSGGIRRSWNESRPSQHCGFLVRSSTAFPMSRHEQTCLEKGGSPDAVLGKVRYVPTISEQPAGNAVVSRLDAGGNNLDSRALAVDRSLRQ